MASSGGLILQETTAWSLLATLQIGKCLYWRKILTGNFVAALLHCRIFKLRLTYKKFRQFNYAAIFCIVFCLTTC